jgi:hypothetical protein
MDGSLQIGSDLSLWSRAKGEYPQSPHNQPEGVEILHHKRGWTALSFWDRTGDERITSNSNFFADEILTFDQIVEAAKAQFPTIWARFTFPVNLRATVDVAPDTESIQ